MMKEDIFKVRILYFMATLKLLITLCENLSYNPRKLISKHHKTWLKYLKMLSSTDKELFEEKIQDY